MKLLDSGFGQYDDSVEGIAIVTSEDANSVGEFVTVSMNFLDESGSIVATQEQIESFSWVGQQLVIPVYLSLSDSSAGVKVASVDASVSLSNHGRGEAAMPPIPLIDAKSITTDENKVDTAAFEFTNDTGSDISNARVGIVCYDEAGKIIGGSSEYPSLLAGGKASLIESSVLTPTTPASCKASVNYGD